MTTYSHKKPDLDTCQALVSTFGDFLTVAIHTILYERNIYPRTSFLSARKYNCPVRQNRHPKVCKWIQDAVAAVEIEMLKGLISQTSLIIYSPASAPLERFVFATPSFPTVPPSETLTPFATTEEPIPTTTSNSTNPIPSTTTPTTTPTPTNPQPSKPKPKAVVPHAIDLEEQFRAIFTRLGTIISTLSPLPADCTYTVAMELKDRVDPPLKANSPWIPAQPSLQRPIPVPESSLTTTTMEDGKEKEKGEGEREKGEEEEEEEGGVAGEAENSGKGRRSQKRGRDLGGIRTTPVRAVEAGAFVMEMWIEEGRAKDDIIRDEGRAIQRMEKETD